jgi:hypothetical protein
MPCWQIVLEGLKQLGPPPQAWRGGAFGPVDIRRRRWVQFERCLL